MPELFIGIVITFAFSSQGATSPEVHTSYRIDSECYANVEYYRAYGNDFPIDENCRFTYSKILRR